MEHVIRSLVFKEGESHEEIKRAAGSREAFYLDLSGAGTQLHIAKDNSQHLMLSILEFGEASHVSGTAAQIARKAVRRV